MSSPRRHAMHAAVAAGGASAALMSAGVFGTDDEVLAASRECLGPVLRAAVLLIEAAAGLRGTPERERLRQAIESYVDAAPASEQGRCRICGCTETNACVGVAEDRFGNRARRNCAWTDRSRTLCDNPSCLEAAARVVPGAAESAS